MSRPTYSVRPGHRKRLELDQRRWIGLQPMPEDERQDEPEPVECQHCGSDLTGWEGECWWCGEGQS